MTSKRYFYILLSVFIVLVALIIGGTYKANSFLQDQSQKLTDLKTETEAIEKQQTALVQAKKDVERYQDLSMIVKSVVPQDKDQAKTVREIIQIAGSRNVPIKSVTFEQSTLGAPKTGGGTATQTPISQLKPVEGIPGVSILPIQVASAGEVEYGNFLKFLQDLEKNRRTAHVSTINIKPVADSIRPGKPNLSVEFDLTLNAYVKPASK